MSPPNLIQIHEDRIQNLEEGVSETRMELGIVKSEVTNGFKMLSEKLDALHGLKQQVEAMEVTERVRYRVFKIAVAAVTAMAAVAGFFLKLLFGG